MSLLYALECSDTNPSTYISMGGPEDDQECFKSIFYDIRGRETCEGNFRNFPRNGVAIETIFCKYNAVPPTSKQFEKIAMPYPLTI